MIVKMKICVTKYA